MQRERERASTRAEAADNITPALFFYFILRLAIFCFARQLSLLSLAHHTAASRRGIRVRGWIKLQIAHPLRLFSGLIKSTRKVSHVCKALVLEIQTDGMKICKRLAIAWTIARLINFS